MDLATIIGLVGGSLLVLSAVILGGSALIFLNIPGILIVVGGTLATTFIKFTMIDVIGSIKVVMKAFLVKMEAPENIIEKMDIGRENAVFFDDISILGIQFYK